MDVCPGSLNLENVSPKEGVGGSSPSGAANLNSNNPESNALRSSESVPPHAPLIHGRHGRSDANQQGVHYPTVESDAKIAREDLADIEVKDFRQPLVNE
jgi:hypothetical protein